MDNEIWLPVSGYERFYQVSNLGRVRSLPKKHQKKHEITRITLGRILPVINGQVLLNNRIKDRQYDVHDLVEKAFRREP